MKRKKNRELPKDISDSLFALTNLICNGIEDNQTKRRVRELFIISFMEFYNNHLIGIPGAQKQCFDCKLPYQKTHSFIKGKKCENNNGHKFCSSHMLTNCPICGGKLENI